MVVDRMLWVSSAWSIDERLDLQCADHFDTILTAVVLLLTAGLLVVGVCSCGGTASPMAVVHDQLAAQQIFFPRGG